MIYQGQNLFQIMYHRLTFKIIFRKFIDYIINYFINKEMYTKYVYHDLIKTKYCRVALFEAKNQV